MQLVPKCCRIDFEFQNLNILQIIKIPLSFYIGNGVKFIQMKKTVLYFLFLLLFSITSSANTYRINSETQLKDILPKLIAGDEVIIANGNYTDWAIEIANKGTEARPILIRAETADQVIFSGDVDQTIFKITGDFIVLKGISFKNCNLVKANGKTGLLVEFKNTKNCRLTASSFIKNKVNGQFMPLVVVSGNGLNNQIDHCTFDGNIDNQDVQVKITPNNCPLYTLITNNLFKDKNRVSWKNGNGGECVQIGQDPVLLGGIEAKSIISENKFISCNGENEVISNKSSNNRYLKNYFKDNDGELVMRGGHDCLIEGNIFEGGTGGIRINGTGHAIINNKIDHIKTAIRLMYGMAKGKNEVGFYIAASHCTIQGNQISNATTGILIGDSKNADWTGKFDVVKYPSRTMQDVAPFDNQIAGNTFSHTKTDQVSQ